ncbi:MAG: methyltransferase domain-containing protein [Caldilineaceae bacterium]
MFNTNGAGQNGRGAYLQGVQAYYEQNTTWFSWVRRRNHNGAIHRPVWAEGIATREDALNYVNAQIGQRINGSGAPETVLDLGCGFGATAHFLSRRFGNQVRIVGMTISGQQARIAQQRAADLNLPNCQFLEGDFQNVPVCAEVDVIYSIEAFAHAYAPHRYLAEVARLLKPGGRLILCDDFRRSADFSHNNRNSEARWISLFQRGWHVPHLLSAVDVTHAAADHGLRLTADVDFSPYLRLRAFPSAAIPIFEAAMQHNGSLTATIESVLGGFALEECIRQGWVQYRFLVFEKMND